MRLIDADSLRDDVNLTDEEIDQYARENVLVPKFWKQMANYMKAARDGFIVDIDETPTVDPESIPIVKELRDKLVRYEQLEAEGRIKILPKGKKGTCGSCQHFHRIPGMQRGTCDIKEQRVDRWGNPHKGWGRFEPGQSKPAYKQYKDAEGLER